MTTMTIEYDCGMTIQVPIRLRSDQTLTRPTAGA